jgi:hypothetical protein
MTVPKQLKSPPTWSDVKAKLADFDRGALLGLVQDLHAASKENRDFLHARFGLVGDVLESYKLTIHRWLSPDVFKKQDTSVVKAKKAIADYKKAVGRSEGLAELMVFYCECAARFTLEYGAGDEGYLDALVAMFRQALKVIARLPAEQREPLIARLAVVCDLCTDFGYGVVEVLSDLLGEYEEQEEKNVDCGAGPERNASERA